MIAHVFDAGDEVWGVAIFANEKSYRDNANDPATDKDYRQMRELLEADPEWHGGYDRGVKQPLTAKVAMNVIADSPAFRTPHGR